jgi:asparagine synthetase B (glutamine-hydrolysing)
MCGIHVLVSGTPEDSLPVGLRQCLCNRGPDHFAQAQAQLGALFLTFTSTVLSLRGDHVTNQPFLDPSTGSIFCWNGEAWRVGGSEVQGNDGKLIFALLTNASASVARGLASVLDVLRAIEGPFAFIYLDKIARRLYFGRDRLGRRSLLSYADRAGQRLSFSSVAGSGDARWEEVEADGIYTVDLASGHHGSATEETQPWATRHAWLTSDEGNFVSTRGMYPWSRGGLLSCLQV